MLLFQTSKNISKVAIIISKKVMKKEKDGITLLFFIFALLDTTSQLFLFHSIKYFYMEYKSLLAHYYYLLYIICNRY
jgi:hypothetical protein